MDVLEIPVTYKNRELSLKAHHMRFGYVSHVVVDLGATLVTIERDEEGNYRALVDREKIEGSKVDIDLIKAVKRYFNRFNDRKSPSEVSLFGDLTFKCPASERIENTNY